MAKIIHPDQNPTQNGQLNKERNNGSLDKKFRGLSNSSEYIIIYVKPRQDRSNKNIIKCIYYIGY